MTIIYLSIISFSISALGAGIVIKYAQPLGVVDIANSRSSHTGAIPKGGGIGILFSVIMVGIILQVSVFLLMPTIAISILSLWGGDKQFLSAKKRLVLQFLCSIVFLIYYFLSKQQVPYSFFIPAIIFIVGTSNFYNFMDGIDGIAGISGAIAFGLLSFYINLQESSDYYGDLCISISFACLGFLCFNFPRAKVFLGDIGSIQLGFLFSVIVICVAENVLDFLVMTGFLFMFYFDELFTMVNRLRSGESLITAHRKHIYQVLANELGFCHWKISMAYGFLQIIIGFSFMFLKAKGIPFIIGTYLIYSVIFAFISISIHKKVLVK